MPLPELFAAIPEPFAAAFDPERPWDLLGEPLDAVLASLPTQRIEIGLSPDFHLAGDRIAIGAGTRIHPTVVIEGPIHIGAGVTVRAGAYLRGGCWIGDGAVVGANTEVKHAVLFPGARAPHLAYVGDAVLGAGVNLGAGTILSNFRHDGREIVIPTAEAPLPTGRRKLGAILGDGVQTGCNCVLHPGCIVGAGTRLYPGVQLRPGIYEAKHLIKLRQDLEIVGQDEDPPATPDSSPRPRHTGS
jgi:bifunctional UDP-N-acetylglucosamine pyrophosphorylase / glucosamine-1-phosphate N-acetyltransferase